MEDCLRHNPCDLTKNFKQSRPVPLELFLSRFLNSENEADWDQTEPPKKSKAKKKQRKFDDWDSEEDDEPLNNSDSFPENEYLRSLGT